MNCGRCFRPKGARSSSRPSRSSGSRRGRTASPSRSSTPSLSPRSNVIIIADEAHRSQYGFLEGYARYLADALPNARRHRVHGHADQLQRGGHDRGVRRRDPHLRHQAESQEDHATVPIFYAPRQIKLHLNKTDIDGALQEIADKHPVSDLERRKSQWAALAAAAGAKDRVDELAQDLLAHFLDRTATLAGKAMVVCMTRANCVALYDALTALPDCPEIKIVMTGNLGEDPPKWSRDGHLTTKAQRDLIKKRMVDPDDPLKMVIVCDMWLTGTDIPCLHTLYVDKPMQGHNMIQAISRVNRVFRDKPHGLIVDYIGIGEDLREPPQSTPGRRPGRPGAGCRTAGPSRVPGLPGRRSANFCPQASSMADGGRCRGSTWRICTLWCTGVLADDDDLRTHFLTAELRLSQAFLLVKHLDDCRVFADEVIFYQRVRKQIDKSLPGKKPHRELEKAVRDLVDDSVESEGVVDIFKAAGIAGADVSILDDRFLQTFKDLPQENLRLKLLQKLLRDEIQRRQKGNLAKAKSFRELLEATLTRYHNRLIDAATLIAAMVQIKKEMDSDDQRAAALNLEPEELAFYDAVAANAESVYGQPFLRDLIHEVVQTIKRNLKVDWTEPHREDVKAAVRAAVKRVLRAKGVQPDDFEQFVAHIMSQAEALFADWPAAIAA